MRAAHNLKVKVSRNHDLALELNCQLSSPRLWKNSNSDLMLVMMIMIAMVLIMIMMMMVMLMMAITMMVVVVVLVVLIAVMGAVDDNTSRTCPFFSVHRGFS